MELCLERNTSVASLPYQLLILHIFTFELVAALPIHCLYHALKAKRSTASWLLTQTWQAAALELGYVQGEGSWVLLTASLQVEWP